MSIKNFSPIILMISIFFFVPQYSKADDTCSIDKALMQLVEYTLKTNADNAKKMRPLLLRMAELNNKATNQSLPIGAQLSKPDLDEFEKISTKTLDLTIRNHLNSNLLRDAQVLSKTIEIARDRARGKFPEKGSKDEDYLLIEMFIWTSVPDLEITQQTSNDGCSMIAAIENYQIKIASNLDPQRVQQLMSKIKIYQDKYHVGSNAGWQDRMPEGSDKTAAGQINDELIHVKSTIEFIKALEKIKLIQKLSDRQFSMLTTALNKARTRVEIEQIASVYDQVADKKSDSEQKSIAVLNLIGSKFPTEESRLRGEMLKPLQDQGLIPNN